ncbi:MAG: efflux RND transporter permease subunit [Candidatus Saccharimonadales bacterium]
MAARPKKAITAKTKPAKAQAKVPKDKLLSRLTVFFFDRPLLTAFLWIALTLFGVLSYTTFLKREGFPSVNFPLALVNGVYFTDDLSAIDTNIARPISDIALKQDGVASVSSQTAGNFFNVQISFDEGVDAKAATAQLEQSVKEAGALPQGANVVFTVPYFGATGGSAEKIDMAISFFPKEDGATTEDIAKAAATYAAALKDRNIDSVQDVFVINPFKQARDPATGQAATVQQNFDRFGLRENDVNTYRDSVIIAVTAKDGFDVVKLDDAVAAALADSAGDESITGYRAVVSASFAPSIRENISELQKSLLEGLIAVLIVGSVVIALRASIITVISMITVLAMTLGFLYAIGYSLNVITLFSLILALALIVDDTIIMVEAIDAARHRHKDRRKAVQEATRKVSRAMVAATLTAALSFAPLLFVGGILGTFIRAIPITIVAALLISLIVALVFIPYFARNLLLGPKQMGKKGVTEIAAGFEAAIANFITKPMRWARASRKKLFAVGSSAVLVGLGFILAGVLIARDVPFNIFPPTKDTNGLSVSITFPPNQTIDQAEAIAASADKILAGELGENFRQASYFNSGSAQNASQQIEIISYTKRDITSPELVDKLQAKFDKDFDQAQVAVGQVDVGPPAASFVVQIRADDRQAAFKAAADMQAFMENARLERPNGTSARFTNVSVSNPAQFIRTDGQAVITVSAGFDGDDTSTLVTLGEAAIKDEFDKQRLLGYGLPEDAVRLDLGFESQNQDSFKTLALAFPVLLVVMYILLAIQFRSLLQPLLIFMAIPFSLFGISLGLSLTGNAFSFFAMLGFFALLGLSVKNTILLTDFANQARREGMGAVDSAVAALRERFRPLFATSVTAVVSLIPLALTSPFWEGLMVVLIFGLISSTFLVVTVFPYYYLGAEYLRLSISRTQFMLWLIFTGLAAALVWWLVTPAWGLLVMPLSLAVVALRGFWARRLTR